MDLREVESFGGIEAYSDSRLDEYFTEHEAYLAARDHKRFLIVGRKGTGKTAIFQQLQMERSPTSFAFGHTFSQYPWAHHNLQATPEQGKRDRFTASWTYMILLTACKILLNRDESVPDWSNEVRGDYARLRKFFLDSYGSLDPDVVQIFDPGKELRLSASLGMGIGPGQAGVNLERVPVSRLPMIIHEVNANIQRAVIKCLNPSHDYYVCFDELDLEFDPEDSTYEQQIIGLILAARRFSEAARAEGRKLSVLIFLREDIYDFLNFQNKNAYTYQHLQKIQWNHQLKELMEKRFGVVFGVDPTGSWGHVFDETEALHERSKYDHMIESTYMRPRDMIVFCNEVLSAFKATGEVRSKFSWADVRGAYPKYSRFLLGDLKDEMSLHVPHRDLILEFLGTVGRPSFNRVTLIQRWSDNESELRGVSIDSILSDLLKFSVIGYNEVGHRSSPSEYRWRYTEPDRGFPFLVRHVEHFRVHPGLEEALGLVEQGMGPRNY